VERERGDLCARRDNRHVDARAGPQSSRDAGVHRVEHRIRREGEHLPAHGHRHVAGVRLRERAPSGGVRTGGGVAVAVCCHVAARGPRGPRGRVEIHPGAGARRARLDGDDAGPQVAAHSGPPAPSARRKRHEDRRAERRFSRRHASPHLAPHVSSCVRRHVCLKPQGEWHQPQPSVRQEGNVEVIGWGNRRARASAVTLPAPPRRAAPESWRRDVEREGRLHRQLKFARPTLAR